MVDSSITYLSAGAVEGSVRANRAEDLGRGSLTRHPFIARRPTSEAQALIAAGAWRTTKAGERDGGFQDACVTLLVRGVLIETAPDSRLCVGMRGPDDITRLETIGGGAPVAEGWWFSNGLCFDIPAADVIDTIGEVETMQMLAGALADARRHVGQEAICNARHPAHARLARCLIRLSALAKSDRLAVTQSELADMLALQRTSVSAAMSELQARKMVTVLRGRLNLVDVDGLRAETCGCGVRHDVPTPAAAVYRSAPTAPAIAERAAY